MVRRTEKVIRSSTTDDRTAEEIIVYFIQAERSRSAEEVNAFDVAARLRLPVSQVFRILKGLKSRGVREVE